MDMQFARGPCLIPASLAPKLSVCWVRLIELNHTALCITEYAIEFFFQLVQMLGGIIMLDIDSQLRLE